MDDWRSYDRVAATYERVHAPRMAEPARDLIEVAGIRDGDRVLDLGTGTGVAAQAAADAGANVIGVDGSVGMLAVARSARADVRVAAATAIDLPFRAGAFDVVIGGFVLAHFAKVETALFDVARVTKPGGRVAFSAWVDGHDTFQQTWAELLTSVVPKQVLTSATNEASPGLDRFTSRGAVQETLYEAGFRKIRTETRRYRFTYRLDDYVEGLGVWAPGRFVHGMLGDAGWEALLARAQRTFADRFPDPIQDFRDAVFAVGSKE